MPALLEELDALLQAIPRWKTYPLAVELDDRREPLHPGRDRLVELTEAWFPVHTPYGPGILVFANSD